MSDITKLGIDGEPIETYHANPAVSHSKLRFFAGNFAATYKAKHIDHSIPEDESEAFTFGSYFHALALEGQEATDKRFAVLPTGAPKRPTAKQLTAKKPSPDTLAAIAWWDDFGKQIEGKELIDADDVATAKAMASGVWANPTAVALLQAGRAEVTFRHSKVPGMALQTRPDWWNPAGCDLTDGRPYIVDVKTISNLKTEWQHQFFKFGYHLAAAFARSVISDCDGWEGMPPDYLFLVVEKEGTNQCEVYRPDEATLDEARRQNLCDLKRLLACYQTGNWPGGAKEIQNVSAPDWWITKTKT